MSQVAISGNASGTGTLTIASPNTNSNYTLTLPTATTTIVGTDATQTLTNKTLTTPIIDSAQVATVSGTAPLYMARAWVNFNGTGTPAIRASGNVSSITDNGVGDYTLNFSTAMPDTNYSFSGGTNSFANTDSGSQVIVVKTDAIGGTATTYTTSAFRFLVGRYGGTVTDSTYNNVMIFR
jgi:hypothetical protein